MNQNASLRAERARRASERMNEVLSVARVVGFLAVVYSAFAIVFFGYGELSYFQRLLGLVLAMATMSAAWTGAIQGRWTGMSQLGFLLFVVSVAWLVYTLNKRGGQANAQAAQAAMLLTAVGAALLVVLTGVRLLSPAQGAFFLVPLLLGLFVAELVIERKDARVGGERLVPPMPTATTGAVPGPGGVVSQSAVGLPNPQKVVEWSLPISLADDLREHMYRPLCAIKTYYPSDPRGTLEEEPLGDALDQRLWGLFLHGNGKGTIERPAERQGVFRLTKSRSEPRGDMAIQLANSAYVYPGTRYIFCARLRATRPIVVSMAVATEKNQMSYETRSVELSTGPCDVTLPFTVPGDVNRIAVFLGFAGDAEGTVEVLSSALTPARLAGWGRSDLREWMPIAQKGMRLWVEDSAIDRVKLRVVRGGNRDPWSAMFASTRYAVKAGDRYVLSLRARADRPRAVVGQWVADHAPWTNIGCDQTWQIGPQWAPYQVEFTSSVTDEMTRAQILLGHDDGEVEIENVSLRPASQTPDEARPIGMADLTTRYSMLHVTNSFGFRDREHSVAKPAGTFRICCMGDSLTFGQGVREGDRYCDLLEKKLNELAGASGPKFEVLNFGVCGYSTWQERHTYEAMVRQFKGDLVTLQMHPNDVRSAKEDAEFARLQRGGGGVLAIADRIRFASSNDSYLSRLETDMAKFGELVKKDQSKFLVFSLRDSVSPSWFDLAKAARAGCQRAGVPFVDLGSHITKDHKWEALIVHHPADAHPNELSHRLAAEALVEVLIAEGLVPIDRSKSPGLVKLPLE